MLRKRNALTIVEVIVVIAVLLLLAALIFPTTVESREAARQNTCMNNLKQIGFALQNYHGSFGHFPPAYTTNDENERLHSWRMLILPVLEAKTVFGTTDLTESWDSPINSKSKKFVFGGYECPSTDLEPGHTTYQAPVGPNWAFAGKTPRSLDDFEDITSRTLLLVEVDSERAVHWMSPHDFEEKYGLPFDQDTKGPHANVIHAVFVDGHIVSIPGGVDPEALRGMLTIAGGEKLDSQ